MTVSTLNPTVGIVVTDWPNLSLYKIAARQIIELAFYIISIVGAQIRTRFASCVQAQHQNAHLLVAEDF